MQVGAKIFHHLDEERKIMGFSISEIVMSTFICLAGFMSNNVALSIGGIVGSVVVVRYLKDLLKKTNFKRRMFFIFSDLLGRKKTKYYGKYYL